MNVLVMTVTVNQYTDVIISSLWVQPSNQLAGKDVEAGSGVLASEQSATASQCPFAVSVFCAEVTSGAE